MTSPYLTAAARRAALPIRVTYIPPQPLADRICLKEVWCIEAGRVLFTAHKPAYAAQCYLEMVEGLR